MKINSHLESNLMLIKVCALQNIIARPSTKDYFNSEEKICYPIALSREEILLGRIRNHSKGKQHVLHKKMSQWSETPRKILENVLMAIHVMFINNINNICNDSIMIIYFVTSELVKYMKESTIVMSMEQVV